MWAFGQEQSLIAAGQDKHARYLKEAAMVRLVQAVSWRSRVATTLRDWADGGRARAWRRKLATDA